MCMQNIVDSLKYIMPQKARSYQRNNKILLGSGQSVWLVSRSPRFKVHDLIPCKSQSEFVNVYDLHLPYVVSIDIWQYKVLVAIFTCGPCEPDALQLDRLVSHKLEHEEVVAAGERERVSGGRPGDAGHQLTGADGGAAIPDLQEV